MGLGYQGTRQGTERAMKTKHCGGCSTVKHIDDFANNRRAKDGRQYHCRECMNEHGRMRKALIKSGEWQVTKRKVKE